MNAASRTEKKIFVKEKLFPLITEFDNRISDAEYETTATGEEYVIIQHKDGSLSEICVTGDSLSALTRDVLKIF